MHPLTQAVIRRSPRPLRPAVTLAGRTLDGALADRLPGLAAELAFWVLLSAPALLLTAVATVGLVAGETRDWQDQLLDRIVELASVALTSDAIENVVRPLLERLVENTTLSVVSIAFLGAVWTASRAVKVVLVTIALTYGEEEPSGWRRRLFGFALTLVGLVVGLVLAPLVIVGPGFGERIGTLPGIDRDLVATVWRLAYWPAAALLATAALATLYHVGAPWHTRWRRDLPGAVLATVGWLAGSAGLRLYGTWVVGGDSSVYGPLAGPIVVLLWVWLTGFVVLLGAELNAQIELLWPSRSEDDTPPGWARRVAAMAAGPLP